MKLFKFFAMFLLFAFSSCLIPNKVVTTDISSMYDKEANFIDFNYTVFHDNDTTSVVYFSINSSSLLFVKPFNKNNYTSEYIVKYELYSEANQKKPVDSLSRKYKDSLNYKKNIDLIDSIMFKAKFPGNYYMIFTISDLKNDQSYKYIINVYKSDRNSRQNFMLRDKKGLPVMKNFITDSCNYKIAANYKGIDKLVVFYYKRDFPVAEPPHIEVVERPFGLKPDSIFRIELSDGNTSTLPFNLKGFYHVNADTSQKQGITLFRFYEDFPKIKTPQQMLQPLKYITTKAEYNNMCFQTNTKSAIDNFWLDKAGNSDRAKELIRKFYNRVQDANIFFTSYIEGWKTDRGMIYIVFGQPNVVYRSAFAETWIYGEENNILSLSLSFAKVNNPFTDNDYNMKRDAGFKDSWYAAVEAWRK